MSQLLTDELDIASELENREREAALFNILKNIPEKRNIEELLIKDLKCIECDDIIPIERQRIVLTIHKTCDYCIECQRLMDYESKLYNF